MTKSAQSTIHSLAGSTPIEGCVAHDGVCWVCANDMTRGMPVARWMGATYTDQNKARSPESTHVCEACVWCMSWVQPPGFPPAEPGKKGLNLRLFSHLHDERGYLALNKADKPAIRQWLREPKRGAWFAAIADTGQKHVLPWTPVNPGQRGVVRFEETNVSLPSAAGWTLLDDMTRMLTGGVTKNEIARGDYSVRTWREFEPATVRDFERLHGSKRGSAWFSLALWMSQRDEEIYATTQRGKARSAASKDGQRTSRTARAVSRKRSKPTQTLGTNPGTRENGGKDHDQRRAVGDGDATRTADLVTKQQTLEFDS